MTEKSHNSHTTVTTVLKKKKMARLEESIPSLQSICRLVPFLSFPSLQNLITYNEKLQDILKGLLYTNVETVISTISSMGFIPSKQDPLETVDYNDFVNQSPFRG